MDARALERIAAALERIAPAPSPTPDLGTHPAWHWDGDALHPARFRPLPLAILTGIDRQKAEFLTNTARHASGAAAHDCLLWGARGTGKSALVKAVTGALIARDLPLRLVEADASTLPTIPALFARLAPLSRPVLLFLDDLGFGEGDAGARRIRSLLDGGADERPVNVRLVVTSNRRSIVERHAAEQADPLNPRDGIEDALALADRFGLRLGFPAIGRAAYLAMTRAYAERIGAVLDEQDAIAFAHSRGGPSGRVAWHYAIDLAGRSGQRLDML